MSALSRPAMCLSATLWALSLAESLSPSIAIYQRVGQRAVDSQVVMADQCHAPACSGSHGQAVTRS